jgi:hypothetical protein
MITINPQLLEKNGKKEFAILPYKDFLKLQEELACYDDLRFLREAKKEEQNAVSVTFEEAKNILNIK